MDFSPLVSYQKPFNQTSLSLSRFNTYINTHTRCWGPAHTQMFCFHLSRCSLLTWPTNDVKEMLVLDTTIERRN